MTAMQRPSGPAAGKPLVLDGITHRYGGSVAVEDINLDVRAGELIALLGPSGCGKTTLLRIVAGFVAQSQGRVIVGDDVMDGLPPNRRSVGIVFQNYALFPHTTITVTIAALSGVLIVFTVALILLMERLTGLSKRLT
jgi:putative spermidine/putrescine transport system ATP-binding protein